MRWSSGDSLQLDIEPGDGLRGILGGVDRIGRRGREAVTVVNGDQYGFTVGPEDGQPVDTVGE